MLSDYRRDPRTVKASGLRLALVITELEPGGAERCLVQLATGLAHRGFRVQVASLAPPPQNPLLVQQLQAAGIAVTFLGLRGLGSLPGTAIRLWRWLRREQPEVIQSFLFHANVLVAVLPRQPRCRRYWGVRVADPRRVRAWAERRLIRRVTAAVCVSQAVASFCEHRVRLPPDKLLVIPNGIAPPGEDSWGSPPSPDSAQQAPTVAAAVDLPPGGASTFEVPGDRPYLLYAGRLDPQKGLDWLLALLPTIMGARPELQLVLLGDGSERQALSDQAARLGLQDRVHFLGWRADVPFWLAGCQLLVLPSRWEGMPNVVLEAMAAGKAVLATAVEGVRELLGPAADLQTVAPGDEPAWLQRCDQLLASDQLRRELGEQNRARALAQFSLTRMLDRYADLYGPATWPG